MEIIDLDMLTGKCRTMHNRFVPKHCLCSNNQTIYRLMKLLLGYSFVAAQ